MIALIMVSIIFVYEFLHLLDDMFKKVREINRKS